MELARYCASIEIECILPYEEIHNIKEEIVKIGEENFFHCMHLEIVRFSCNFVIFNLIYS
jgi:hypothetical protein